MFKATIDVENRCLRYKSDAGARAVHWQALSTVTAAGTEPALFDEVALLFDADQQQIFVVETDPDFDALCKALELDRILSPDWYAQAESGKRSSANLNGNN